MSNYPGESVSQLVLDNRKLIIGFCLLILICGLFFVIGFMEGKRQGLPRAAEKISEGQIARRDASAQVPSAKSASNQPMQNTPENKDVRDKLDWYGRVNKPGEGGVKGLEPEKPTSPVPSPVRKTESPPASHGSPAFPKLEPKAKPSGAVVPAKVSYSVQVGAFRQRKEAEAKAAVLQAKKYACTIEPSGEPNQFFLLKVGKYDSRADAIAMQNRLKKDGFSTFIKTYK